MTLVSVEKRAAIVESKSTCPLEYQKLSSWLKRPCCGSVNLMRPVRNEAGKLGSDGDGSMAILPGRKRQDYERFRKK